MPPFFLFVDAASLWRPEIVKASLPEVNQFTGNCFRMVRLVLKITFLGLRYPGQRPECPSLSYYGSCTNSSYKRRDPRTEAKENAYLNCIASEINPVRNNNDKKLLINLSETGQLHDLST